MAELEGGEGGAAGRADFGIGPGITPSGARHCLVLGNFDGVHIGHQSIVARARARARASASSQELVAITFEPHPKGVVEPGHGPALLTPLELRRRLLVGCGVDRLWVIPFDRELSLLSPDQFMAGIERRAAIEAMVVGPGFSVGRPGEGELEFLLGFAREHGFEVEVVEARTWAGEAVSSSRIRRELAAGHLEEVEVMLGRPFQVLAPVVAGKGWGRKLGFPTANLRLAPGQALPPQGIYAMELATEEGRVLPAVGSIGTRPHFGGTELAFEVHCLEPCGDLYGQEAQVNILRWLREQASFGSDSLLVEQMSADVRSAAAYLTHRRGGGRGG